MKIEIAQPSDIPALCGLLGALFSQEAEFSADEKAQTRGLEMLIADSRIGHILVARERGEILAMVNILYTLSTALGGRVALLEDMIVAEPHRGRGVGRQLLEYALEFAGSQGCGRITLLTDGDNHGAHRFYQSQGFEHSSMVVFRQALAIW